MLKNLRPYTYIYIKVRVGNAGFQQPIQQVWWHVGRTL